MEYGVVVIIALVLLVGFIIQVRRTLAVILRNKSTYESNSRTRLGYILTTLFYAVFLGAYILNMFTSAQSLAINETVVQICFISLVLVMISKFVVIPRTTN